MTKEEIYANNSIINKFMGYPHNLTGIGAYSDEILYHNSWGWIMPVIEKIEAIYDDHHGYFGVYINGNNCTIQGTKLHVSVNNPNYGVVYFNDITLTTKIESTYHAIVQFIKWYDVNLKNKNE